jgi:hypothetical protein
LYYEGSAIVDIPFLLMSLALIAFGVANLWKSRRGTRRANAVQS